MRVTASSYNGQISQGDVGRQGDTRNNPRGERKDTEHTLGVKS